jgi:hypothetical protein
MKCSKLFAISSVSKKNHQSNALVFFSEYAGELRIIVLGKKKCDFTTRANRAHNASMLLPCTISIFLL